jgi:signal transduction histidine kinase
VTGAVEPDRLAVLVHEVRSPVAALAAIASALEAGGLDRSERSKLAALAIAACRSIERVVGDVAVASVRLEEVDAGPLVQDAARAASLAGARVRAVVEPGLPSVRADAARLRQALDNLVSNALLHSPEDGEVVLRARLVGEAVLLSVTDTGVGISPEDQRRIFDPGVRLDAGKPGAGLGLGLGLAIAKAIAEAHRGTLTLDSAPGRGATFTLALPAG